MPGTCGPPSFSTRETTPGLAVAYLKGHPSLKSSKAKKAPGRAPEAQVSKQKRQQFSSETRLYLPLSASDLAGVASKLLDEATLVKVNHRALSAPG